MAWVRWAGRNFDAGKPHHTWVVWCVTVLRAGARWSALLYLLLRTLQPGAGAGLRRRGAVPDPGLSPVQPLLHRHPRRAGARRRGRGAPPAAEWRHLDASELPRTEVLRHVIEHALLAAHRHVFGVFFWFVVAARRSAWGRPARCCTAWPSSSAATGATASARSTRRPTTRLLALSQRLFALIDHVPARLTAFGFAVVGNFEEADQRLAARCRAVAACQRGHHPGRGGRRRRRAAGRQAAPGVTPDRSKTFSAGAHAGHGRRRGLDAGVPLQPGHLQSVVGLVWRSVVLWMLLLALLTLANVLG